MGEQLCTYSYIAYSSNLYNLSIVSIGSGRLARLSVILLVVMFNLHCTRACTDKPSNKQVVLLSHKTLGHQPWRLATPDYVESSVLNWLWNGLITTLSVKKYHYGNLGSAGIPIKHWLVVCILNISTPWESTQVKTSLQIQGVPRQSNYFS